MLSKKILIISVSFYPMNTPRSFRTTELAKEFSRQGHEVTIITPYDPKQEELKSQYNFTLKNLGQPLFPEIKWNGKNRLLQLFFQAIRRLFLILFEYPQIGWMFKVRKKLKQESDYDLMISIAVPHMVHWGTAWARTKSNPIAKLWVADCGDPYAGITYDKFKKPFYFKWLEKFFCRKADHITVPIEGARTAYFQAYRSKISVIPQGFKFEETFALKEKYSPNERPKFCYAGNFIPGRRDVRPILDFLLSTNQDFEFHIYTRSKSMVEPYLAKAGDKIKLHSFIPRNELIAILSRMDFLVNIENGISEQLPSKLIDYALIGRPTLSLDSNNLDKEAILDFLKGDYTKQFAYPEMEQYRIDNVCKQFIKFTEPVQEYVEHR